ncbi:MAG: glycosyltransferase family 4 protein [Anaerolineales bacterium]|uniref:Glycosyltransferase family 4 protein n=1 Tax=Candidatus Desulfolinea nitratireducens TaxID=2841698 RepID=A0A8J6NEH5_9CHLR|nr:glycosyltransferase family 4 protein [Candidatus Desulfolinea nitratireducens]
MTRICIVPKSQSGGGGSFRLKFEAGLKTRGIEVTHNPAEESDAILVIGGTRKLLPLWRAKRRGVRIVQRLDGVNWVQRVRWSGVRYTLRAEYGNWLLAFTRNRVADEVIYQSKFIRGWWEDWYGKARIPGHVVLNGVDLENFSPDRENPIPRIPPYRLLVVEGSLAGGLDTGLKAALHLTEILSERYSVKLTVAGKVDVNTKNELKKASKTVKLLEIVSREQIPELMRSSHLLFSAEINPPCPNSVIEALACGLPVVGFDTGSLRELIGEGAGRLTPYGGNPWNLDTPDIPSLAKAASEILVDQERFRLAARVRAEESLGVDKMVDNYLEILLGK